MPDRVFFGYGACHILAGVYLVHQPLPGFHAERIIPDEGFSGGHMYVTDGVIAFDYHGYSLRDRLLAHHRKDWSAHSAGWNCALEHVDFDALDTQALNARKMLGPDQYLHDPRPRALRFIERRNHRHDADRALKTMNEHEIGASNVG